MKVKSLLLLVSAFGVNTFGFGQVGLVHAGNITEPEPTVQQSYVRVCDAYGDKFYYVPGTTTCMSVGGALRAEVFLGNQEKQIRDDNEISRSGLSNFTMHTRGYFSFEAKTDTEYGLLRSYLLFKGDAYSKNTHDVITLNKAGEEIKPVTGESIKSSVGFSEAFVQFAGVTAGYTSSFFYYNSGFDYYGGYASDVTTNTVSYEYKTAGGFSVGAAIEDPTHRRSGFRALPGQMTKISYAAQTIPDVIARIGYDHSLVAVQLSAGYHPTQYGFFTEGVEKRQSENAYGYGVQLAVEGKLPSGNTNIVLSGAYSEGATTFLGFGGTDTYTFELPDGVVDENGSFKKNKGWSVLATLKHKFSEKLRADLTASFANMKLAPGSVYKKVKLFRVSGDLRYYPVKNLEIGVGVSYDKIKGDLYKESLNRNTKLNFVNGLIRIQRSF